MHFMCCARLLSPPETDVIIATSCDMFPREEKCSMVETCTEVQGIWAFVEQVWIPAHLLSNSDKQQNITK